MLISFILLLSSHQSSFNSQNNDYFPNLRFSISIMRKGEIFLLSFFSRSFLPQYSPIDIAIALSQRHRSPGRNGATNCRTFVVPPTGAYNTNFLVSLDNMKVLLLITIVIVMFMSQEVDSKRKQKGKVVSGVTVEEEIKILSGDKVTLTCPGLDMLDSPDWYKNSHRLRGVILKKITERRVMLKEKDKVSWNSLDTW